MLVKMLLGLIVDTPKSDPEGYAEHKRLLAENERKEREQFIATKKENTDANTI